MTVIVFNNGQWGAEKKNHVDFYSRRFQAVNLDSPSWAAVAKAFGCEGVTVDKLSDVGPALQASVQAQAEGKCTVIEMMVTQELGDPFRRDALSKPVRLPGQVQGVFITGHQSLSNPTAVLPRAVRCSRTASTAIAQTITALDGRSVTTESARPAR